MRFALFLLVLFSVTAEAAAIERFKTFLRSTQSARADFEQKVYDRDGKLVQEAKGNFVFQRPGRFRWVYAKPVDQLIVGDGQRVWIYDRDLNQVTVRRISKALGSTPAALLAGSSDIEQAFELSDHFGQTTLLRFSGLIRNPKVDPAEFRFEPPKGADVLGEK